MKSNVLIGSTTCAPCKAVKLFLDNRGITYDYLDIDTEEGLAKAQEWEIRNIPAMNIFGNVVVGERNIKGAFDE